MISKQQKQRYGDILRQQMKQKEQRKKIQDMQKRGQNNRIPQQYSQPQKETIYYQPTNLQKQNPIIQRPLMDPKQQLQKKFQGPQYNYFSGLGGGLPNRKDNRNNISMSNGVRIQPEQLINYNNNRNFDQGYPEMISQQQRGMDRISTQQQERNYYQNQNQSDSISPPTQNYSNQRISNNENNYYSQNPLASNRINYNPYQQNQIQQSYGRDYQQPVSFDYIPANNSRLKQPQYSYPSGNMNSYQQNIGLQQANINMSQPKQIYQPIQQQQQMMSPQQNGMKDSQQLMQVYRKGGRNLLKLQNQTIDEHLIKQKRKLQIQKQLKQQIQQGQKKKKQQKQRIQRQQQLQQRKQLAYIAEQKRKIQQEQRKQKQQRQKIIDQNVRNLQKKKQFQSQAKKKIVRQQKQIIQKQKRQADLERAKIQQQKNQQIKKNQKQAIHYTNQQSNGGLSKNRISMNDEDNTSVVSSQISSLQKGYSTNLPKQFFMKQRQRINPSNNNKKFQSLTYQVQKMQDEIRKQGQIFNKQMYKVKQDAEKALIQKRNAEQQIQRLKKQLKRKMDGDNQKLLKALQSNDYRNQYELPSQQSNNYGYNQNFKNYNNKQNGSSQEQYQNQNKNFKNYESYQQAEQRNNTKRPLRQKQSQKLIKKDYQPRDFNLRQEQYQNLNHSNAGLISLDGESKHIPMNLPNAQNLTISQVQNFAKDSSYFQKGAFNKNSPQKMQKYNNKIYEHQSIPEEEIQERDYEVSRKSNRNNRNNIKSNKQIIQSKDQLDKLMDSRAKSRGGWGQMSSVNSDITKQIQQLLRNKGGNQKNNSRPSSISNAGKQSLARQGYAYDGHTLNSNVGTLNQVGTIDVDKINGRNDARLRQLRNLGVQTINTTNGDEDLERLDKLLNKYK